MLNRIVSVRPGEARALLWSFGYFFCLLAAYYVLRPLRDEMGVAGGVKNLQWLFTATFITMLVAVPIYGALVARLRKEVGGRRIGHELGEVRARAARQHATACGHQHCVLHARLNPQTLEGRHRLRRRQPAELLRHDAGLRLQVDQHLVDRLLAEVDAAFERGVDEPEPFFMFHLCKLDNENRVLGREPDEHDQGNLSVNIIFITTYQ